MVPNNTPLKFRLEIFVKSPSDIVQKLGDSAAVVIEDVCMKSVLEVCQR